LPHCLLQAYALGILQAIGKGYKMGSIEFSYDQALVPADHLSKSIEALGPLIKNTPLEISAVLEDTSIIAKVKDLVARKQKHNPAMMIVVGIGGSNLGAQAVYEALYGKQGNLHFPLYFADTVDSDHIHALMQRAEHALQSKRTIIITVISKSGATTETIANFECFLELLKKYHPNNYYEFVVGITDENSALWDLAADQKFDQLVIPKAIGGRYSVFTAVGLMPLLFAQIDIEDFIKGAHTADAKSAATSASIIAYHYENGKNIHDLFLFDSALESLGKWYRQLMGESLGKDGKGITPTVSMGSTDLHSVGQLYLGGPHDKITTFVHIAHAQHHVQIPNMNEYEKLVAHLQGNTLESIMKAIFEGTQKTYEQRKNPYITYLFPKKNAFSIGQFLQTKMLEMIMLGHLLDVNPFDQPQVELYKTQTRKILANE
jgi:glucose-6-phosphate isomerase